MNQALFPEVRFIMPLKRPHGDRNNNQSDSDTSIAPRPSKRKARQRKPKPPARPKQRATVKELATEVDPADHPFTTNPPAEARILARIRKCFAIANHAGTPETEAKAALRMGSKLMSQHNVTQAEAFEQSNDEDQAQHGRRSVVAITAIHRKAVNYSFTNTLACAMSVFFDCKNYSTGLPSSIEWTFYGIACNTAAAAMAFEMTYNLILHWSMPKKGTSPNNSYSRGAADGLYEIAQEEKRDEMKKAREKEEANMAKRLEEEQSERQKEIDRLNFQMPVSEPECQTQNQDSASNEGDMQDHDDSDLSGIEGDHSETENSEFEVEPDFKEEEEDAANPFADFNSELEKIRQQQVHSIKREPVPEIGAEGGNHVDNLDQENFPESMWASATQLVKFRASANTIADEYVKDQNIKLSYRARRSSAPRDSASYRQGREDSRKIDVRRRRLE